MLNKFVVFSIAALVTFTLFTLRVDAYKCENLMLSSRTIANEIMSEMSIYLTTVPEDTLLFIERSHQRISSIYNFENQSPEDLAVRLNTSLYVEFNIKVLNARESVKTLFSEFKPSEHLDQIVNKPKSNRWSLFRRNNETPPIKELHSNLVNLANQVSSINRDLTKIQFDLGESILLLSEGVERVQGAIDRIEKGQEVYRTIFNGIKHMILEVQPDLINDENEIEFDNKDLSEQIAVLINRLNNHESPQWPRDRIKTLDMILRHFLNFYHSLEGIRESAEELISYYRSQIEVLKGMEDFIISYSGSLVDILFTMINDAVSSVTTIMEIQSRLINLDIKISDLETRVDPMSTEIRNRLGTEKEKLNQSITDLLVESVELNDKTWDDNDESAKKLLEGRNISTILERLEQQHKAVLARIRN